MKRDAKAWSQLFLRLVIVFIFLYHGLPKAFNPGMAMQKFGMMGFPGFFGPVVGWAEVIAAVLLFLGMWHKWANYVLAAIIVVAIVAVQLPGAISAGKVTASIERDLLILASTLVLAASEPGLYVLKKGRKKK